MTNDELIQALRRQLTACAGWEGDEIANDRKSALDYYFMRPNGTEVPGRSTVVSGDVSAVVDATLASMLEAFSGDAIVEIDSLGPEDEEQAQLEADVLTHFVMKESAGALHLAAAIKDALLLRNGWMKVWVEERSDTRYEEYRGVEPEALAALTNRPGAKCEVVKYDETDGYTKLKCTYVVRTFRAEAVPVENVFYPKHYDGIDYAAIQRIPFIAERHVDTRADLYGLFSRARVDELQKLSSETNVTAMTRNPRADTGYTPGADMSSELVEWFECYVIIGGERERVCIGSRDVLLKREPASLVPYAAGAAFVAPHRLLGISLWDKCRQSQDVNTALQRALLDNVQATSKNRLAYLDGRVNPDDLADGRVNGAIRVKPTVARVSDAVLPFVVPDTSSGIQAAIDHQRRIRTELAGAALDLQTAQVQFGRSMGSEGLDRAYSVAEQLSAHMTRTIAQTLVRSVFLLAHATLREYVTEPVPIKREGRWASAVPAEWQERSRLKIKVGMSPGERARRQAALDKLLQSQIALAQLGMEDVLVNVEGYYSLLMDWARVSDIPSPERYFVDPQSEAAQQAMQAKAQQAAEAQALQRNLMQQAVELEKLRTAFDKYKTDAELQFKYWAEQLKSEVAEAQIAGSATVELIKAREAPRGDNETGQSGSGVGLDKGSADRAA